MNVKHVTDNWSNQEFWTKLCPQLSISNEKRRSTLCNCPDSSTSGAEKHDVIISDVRKSLLKDGYALVDEAAGLNFETSAASASKLRNAIKTGIEQLVLKEKLPATFILLFDETWELCRKASKFLNCATHEKNILNFDLLAWYIDPSNGDAGVSFN